MTYTEHKERVRDQAVNWQSDFSNHNYSWDEIWRWQQRFEYLGKRYGLLREFRENGIL